jgi:hypothetical protein
MDWDKLLLNLRNNNCVAIIGAGASRPHIPPAKDLADQLFKKEANPFLDKDGNPIADSDRKIVEDLAAAAQYLAVKHAQGDYPKFRIAEIIRALSIDVKWTAPVDPHQALAQLDLPIYITTNYDNRMKLALQLQNKNVETAICRWNDILLNEETCFDDGKYRPTPAHPVVFHLHGQMEIPKSLVASEDDYLDFLLEMGRQKQQNFKSGSKKRGGRATMLPPVIQDALATKLLLFVGYGIADTNFRVILRGLKTSLRSTAVTSITVQFGGGQREEVKSYLDQYFKHLLDLEVFWGSSDDFASQLAQQVDVWKKTGAWK